MPKMKTNKSAAKRVKITGTGKIKRRSPGVSHLRSRKSPKRLRRFRTMKDLSPTHLRHVRRLLGI